MYRCTELNFVQINLVIVSVTCDPKVKYGTSHLRWFRISHFIFILHLVDSFLSFVKHLSNSPFIAFPKKRMYANDPDGQMGQFQVGMVLRQFVFKPFGSARFSLFLRENIKKNCLIRKKEEINSDFPYFFFKLCVFKLFIYSLPNNGKCFNGGLYHIEMFLLHRPIV